jgi:hypothetical protein
MSQIVGQSRSFRQFRREAMFEQRLLNEQIVGDCTGNLRRLNAVGKTRAIEIGLANTENLGFPLQPAKRSTMQDTIPVSFRRMPVILRGGRHIFVSPLQQKFIHERVYLPL